MLQQRWTKKQYAMWNKPDTKGPIYIKLHLYKVPRIIKFIKIENRIVVTRR